MRFLAYIMLALTLFGCGVPKDHPVTVAVQNYHDSGLAAFSRHFYPLVRANCRDCHGAGTGPQFATADIGASYAVAKRFVNFSAIASSRFVQKVKDAHCGFHCASDGVAMTAAIKTWWENGEDPSLHTDIPAGAVRLSAQTIPASLPVASSHLYTTLTWDLSVVAGLAGCQFQVDIQEFDADAYRLRNPRLITPVGASVVVKTVKPLLNDFFSAQNSAYLSIDTVVPGSTSLILSTTPLLILKEQDGDSLAFEFEILGRN